jgi:signal transduction histidine kinase
MARPRRSSDFASNLPGVVFAFRAFPDRQWEGLWISDGLAELLGPATAEAVWGKPWVLRDRVHPDDLAEFDDAAGRALVERRTFDVQARVRGDRGYRWIHAVARGTILDDESALWNGLLLDVDARQRAEEELKRLESARRDGQRLESLGVLAGGIAHEFNNQLQVVLGNLGVVLDRAEASEHDSEALRAACDAGLRAAELCRRMLDYAGQAPPVTGPVDVNALVREMARLCQVSVPRDAVLALDLAPQPLFVDADPAQLRQVVLNLATNAAEALFDCGTPRQLTIRTHARRAALVSGAAGSEGGFLPGSLEGDDWVQIEFEDSGHGFGEEALARAFDPFFSTRAPGRGMGLAATLGILRAHGGGIRIEPTPPRGTRVQVLLPACSAPSKASATAAAGRGDCVGLVLLVDDEQSVRQVCIRILSARGFEVVAAASGTDAIRLAREARKIDVAVIDLTMPRLDGHETLEELRSDAPGLPAVLISGYDSSRLAGRKLDATTRFLPKPFLPEELVEAVRDALAAGSRQER